jgi:hypothetical protein
MCLLNELCALLLVSGVMSSVKISCYARRVPEEVRCNRRRGNSRSLEISTVLLRDDDRAG